MNLNYKILIVSLFSFGIIFSGSAQTTECIQDSLLKFACNYLETPYRTGGSTPKAFDCSGFTSFVFRNFGYDLYRTSGDQIRNAVKVVDKNEVKRGDLVFFKGRNAKQNRIGHVGIVYDIDENGSFRFIHASCKFGVTITSADKNYYSTRFVAAGRILEERTLLLAAEPLPIHPIKVESPKLID